MIRREGLSGYAALDLLAAAYEPRENPSLTVPAELARRVLSGPADDVA